MAIFPVSRFPVDTFCLTNVQRTKFYLYIKDIFKPRVSWANMTSFRVWNGGFMAFFLWFLFLLRLFFDIPFRAGSPSKSFMFFFAPAKPACFTSPQHGDPFKNNSSASNFGRSSLLQVIAFHFQKGGWNLFLNRGPRNHGTETSQPMTLNVKSP